ncbi:MAG: helix-turn-helix domain-containing protein [Symbiopectobacterium sp.]|uniref:helix-turn-helix domain-containing protein n=1 Tax=Symbiopectobacterium sp. TaxID=2952789 RepID=UPI0039ECBA9B
MEEMSQYSQLKAGEEYPFSQYALLLAQNNEQECHPRISDKGSTAVCTIPGNQRSLLVIAPASVTVEWGELHCLFLDFTLLAKLQVFIDKSMNKESTHCPRTLVGCMPTALRAEPEQKDIEYWLLHQALQGTDGLEHFSNVLRQSEWYALVEFLFDSYRSNSGQRLQTLCARYGLSVSHFRRLSRRVLGNTAKSALRDWRLGQALFELINGDNNLTTIAMNHGYVSLSHFSNEVKEVIGVSPRNLKKLLQAS